VIFVFQERKAKQPGVGVKNIFALSRVSPDWDYAVFARRHRPVCALTERS
jgi:hypothetical protein